MPELPEVETIKRDLEKKVVGKKVTRIKVFSEKPLNVSKDEFVNSLVKGKIEKVERRAKLIIISFSTGFSLLIHLKLTGRLLYLPSSQGVEKHTHVVFSLNDGFDLRFADFRKFGYLKLFPRDGFEMMAELSQYGPEPLDEAFTEKTLKDLLARKRQGKIKSLLMDQSFIAGIGNLYADEILFYAGVKPTRDVFQITEAEIKRITEGIKTILNAAIEKRGSSVDDYVDLNGKKGSYVPYLRVYRRGGKSCYACGAKIVRIKMGSRSTHFCPKCQK